MRLSNKDANAISAAIDFIHTNSDGAEDHDFYANMIFELDTILEKHRKEEHKRLVRYYIKKRKSQRQ